jgi:hypothetical protein
LYAADAALERSKDDLLTVADWNSLLAGTNRSGFVDGDPSGERTLADGSKINIGQIVNMANCGKVDSCSPSDITGNATGDRPWGANNPVWRPYAYGPVNDLVPTATINSPYYVIVLVGDDPSESDGVPTKDGTDPTRGGGVLALRAEAYGPRGAQKVIEMTLSRTSTTELERGYTGQRGQDEQNRRARKAAVQTPGKRLNMQSLNTALGGTS